MIIKKTCKRVPKNQQLTTQSFTRRKKQIGKLYVNFWQMVSNELLNRKLVPRLKRSTHYHESPLFHQEQDILYLPTFLFENCF